MDLTSPLEPWACSVYGGPYRWPCGCGRDHTVYAADAANTNHGWHWGIH